MSITNRTEYTLQLRCLIEYLSAAFHFDKGYKIEQWISKQIHGHSYEDLVSTVTWSFSFGDVVAWVGVGASDEDVDRFDNDDAFICRIFIFEDCIPERKKTKESNKEISTLIMITIYGNM